MIDSSTYIDWMRSGRNPVRILRPFVQAGLLVSCGLVRVEVVRGIVKPAVKAEMDGLFDAIREVPATPALWSRVSELAWRLDRKGIVLPVSDLIIGECAIFENATLVSSDAHFTEIPDLKLAEALPSWE